MTMSFRGDQVQNAIFRKIATVKITTKYYIAQIALS